MKKNKLKIISLFIIMLSFIVSATLSNADDSEAAKNSTGYYYEIEYPDNQIGTSGALNLRVQPGQEQTVNLKLNSYSDKELTVELSVDQAATNDTGGIQYGPNNIALDKSLKYKMSDCVSVPKEVVIPAGESVTVPITIKAPKDEFDGVILGSLQMMEKGQEEENKTDSPVTNVFAFLFGITLSSNETTVKKDLKLNSVKAGLSNYRNAFLIDLSNVSPIILNNFSVDATVTSKKNDTVSYSVKKLDMEMAPNSIIKFPVSLNGEKLVSGEYKAHIKAASGSTEWEWDEEFTVTDEDADKYNREDVSIIQERGLPWKTIIIIVGTILIIVAIVLIIVYLSKKKKRRKK